MKKNILRNKIQPLKLKSHLSGSITEVIRLKRILVDWKTVMRKLLVMLHRELK